MRLIDADELLQALDKQKAFEMLDHKRNSAYGKGMRDAMKIIEDAPTVGGWVSVKDRMPEEHKDVLVTGIEAINNVRVFSVKVNDRGVWRPISAPSVVYDYWMPLPEPPKEEE